MTQKERYLSMIEIRLSLMDENDLRTVYNFMLGMDKGKQEAEEKARKS